MQRRKSPVFQKVSNFLKISIFVAKLRKPIIPKLIFLKRVKKLKLLKHHNYGGFVQEYQFSPSSTPLIHYNRDRFMSRSRRRDIYSMLFWCRSCVGSFRSEEEEDGDRNEIMGGIGGQFSEALDWSDEDDSIDQKAELFIQNFYAEMKMERLASL